MEQLHPKGYVPVLTISEGLTLSVPEGTIPCVSVRYPDHQTNPAYNKPKRYEDGRGACDCGRCEDPNAVEPSCGTSFVCRRCDLRWHADFGSDDDTPRLCDNCSCDIQEGWDATEEEDQAEFASFRPETIVLSRKDFDKFLDICEQNTEPNPALVELFWKYS
jgi:hypothetical protein